MRIGQQVFRFNDGRFEFLLDNVQRLLRLVAFGAFGFLRQHALVCAADMRFPNEFGQIGALNGVRIKVVRPNYVSSTQVNMSHISETALDDHSFDATIVNDGSIKDLWLNLSTSLTKLAKANPKAVDAGYAKVLTV